ncbi:DoxX family protein [Nonomuraea sp. SBT364]|uniref:DoxX family protein n=1 Tax=Nonomuraea sp. SBT364 TaxID=1580530 RepID=UPI00066E2104|nr:DoxX family protein [Nonomuraea sp. SBT364]
MDIALWIIAGLLAADFLVGGVLQLALTKEKLVSAMAVMEVFSPGVIKLVGALEVLAAVGLVLPAVLGVAPVLVPLAAVGLALLMAGAAVTHLRRREWQGVAVTVALLVLAAFVAWGRFVVVPF